MNTAIIKKWKVVHLSENSQMFLSGEVYGHPFFEEGCLVVTSLIKGSKGKKVWTKNTIYTLEDVHPDYLQWVKTNNLNWDEAEPIKMLNSQIFTVVLS
jgi:hypothetical protein